MSFTTTDNVLWAAGFVGQIALLVVLVVKRRVRNFPVFTSLIAYQVFRTVTLFLVSRYGPGRAYFLSYWIMSLGDYVFQIALILEIARNVLRPTGTWVRDARSYFLLWAATGTLAAAGLSIALAPPGFTGLDLWTVRLTVFTSLLTCEVFLTMSAAANRLGLPWGSHVMALGEGLTLWAATALLGDVLHLALGWERELLLFDHVQMSVYVGALGFWMVAFWRPGRQRARLSVEMQNYLVALRKRVQYDLARLKSIDRRVR